LTTVWCSVLVLSLAPLVYGAEAREWSQFRGPDSAGPQFAGTVPQGKFGLQVAWTRDLGSGYSNVWLVPGKAVTMHTDGAVDVVASTLTWDRPFLATAYHVYRTTGTVAGSSFQCASAGTLIRPT